MSATTSDEQPQPWYARKRNPPELMLYRVNRRPRSQPTLFTPERLPDFYEHLNESLRFYETYITGTNPQRYWRIASPNDAEVLRRPALAGQIGFTRTGEHATGEFDEESGWRDVVREIEEGAYAPFVIDSETRVLAVVRHTQFDNPKTVADVFAGLLDRGEEELDEPLVDWAVEPILDEMDFLEWLRTTPVVTRVRFVARLPNPDAIEGHAYIDARLRELNGDQQEEVISTKRESGLRNLEDDAQVRNYIDSARQGFTNVAGEGHSEDGPSRFDQRRQLATSPFEAIPGSWADLVAGMLATFQRWLQRRNGVDE